MSLRYQLLLPAIFALFGDANGVTVTETELFSLPVTPNMFNWTYQEFDRQYHFLSSMLDKPDLPNWMRYVYSVRHHSGFLFGTPPKDQTNITTPSTIIECETKWKPEKRTDNNYQPEKTLPLMVEVIALNKQNYETRRLLIPIDVVRKEKVAKYEVQLKIDNLNVEDMLDEYRMGRLKDIFRHKLWTESVKDLHATFLVSAIELGARLPLKPNEGEGVVIVLGSVYPHSSELQRLREEVRPLEKLQRCPRDYKRTTVERLFRSAEFSLDWCSFKLIEIDESSENPLRLYSPGQTKPAQTQTKHETWGKPENKQRWTPPRRDALPQRSYLREFALAILVPLLLMSLSMLTLSAVVCVHFVGTQDDDSEYFFDNIYHICEDMKNRRNKEEAYQPDILQGDVNVVDNVSPSNSLTKRSTNLAGNYNRPQPPPYQGSNSNTLTLRKSGCNTERTTPSSYNGCETLEPPTNTTLEASLKLLNEANIANRPFGDNMRDASSNRIFFKQPVVDLTDGSEDYVPIDMKRSVLFGANGIIGNNGVPNLICQDVEGNTEGPVKTWFC